MTLFDSPAFEGHEGVHAFFDENSGLKCIIAVHSTARGPAAGGCRMWPFPSADAALEDALRLSRAMSYKNAMADLELGGGKAVIIGDSRTQKTPALFEAFGRAVEDVGGKYWTAEDVGVSPADLMHARKTKRPPRTAFEQNARPLPWMSLMSRSFSLSRYWSRLAMRSASLGT